MGQTTVLIDAHCVMCNGLARFLRKRAKPSAQLEIHGIDTDEGHALIATFPARMQAMDTVYVVRDGVPDARSAGAIRLLLSMRLGGWTTRGSDRGPRVHGRKHRCRLDERWGSLPVPLLPLD